MANIRELTSSFTDWEARIILESLTNELERLRILAETSNDEDIAADAGNDYIEVKLLKDRLEKEATSVFGEQILIFGYEEL
ncbi:hypothetical protein EXA16_17375 [Vibrio cincinnatiensis]|nr:hypothetical protein [Vibrio cincinnatiensis]MCG3738068.1 hypothetical protein [Vibrio cincinnatiensis]